MKEATKEIVIDAVNEYYDRLIEKVEADYNTQEVDTLVAERDEVLKDINK